MWLTLSPCRNWEERRFECDICGNKYIHDCLLKTHSKTHMERATCKVCRKEYLSGHHARQHFIEKHKDNNPLLVTETDAEIFEITDKTPQDKSFYDKLPGCEICGNKFEKPTSLSKKISQTSHLRRIYLFCFQRDMSETTSTPLIRQWH